MHKRLLVIECSLKGTNQWSPLRAQQGFVPAHTERKPLIEEINKMRKLSEYSLLSLRIQPYYQMKFPGGDDTNADRSNTANARSEPNQL